MRPLEPQTALARIAPTHPFTVRHAMVGPVELAARSADGRAANRARSKRAFGAAAATRERRVYVRPMA